MTECFICRTDLKKSVGYYTYTYLSETIHLCGNCANDLMGYAKDMRGYEDYEKQCRLAIKKEKDL